MGWALPAPSREPRRLAVRAMQVAILGVLLAGVAGRSVGVVVNATLALGVTLLPAVLRRDFSIHLQPGLSLWLTGAVLLHAVGMVGLYDAVWWWDHVTHTLSASLVAGAGYATARALDRHSDAVSFPPRFLFVFVVLLTLAFGVLWEVLEFAARLAADAAGVEPVLVQYGLDDTLVDLVFDAVGAVLVGLFGTARLTGVVDALVERLEALARGTE